MPPRDPDGRPADALVVLAWNPHLGNRRVAQGLDALIADVRPHNIFLNEVPFRGEQLEAWARANDYLLMQEEAGDRRGRVVSEHGSSAVLLDKRAPGLSLSKARVTVGRHRWLVRSKNRWHAPRRDWVIREHLAGQTYRLYASHVATGGPDSVNRAAVRDWLRRLRGAIRVRAPWTVLSDTGDHNNPLARLRALFPGARIVGVGPDSTIVLGADADREVLGKHGSDHHAVRYTLTPTRRTRRARRFRLIRRSRRVRRVRRTRKES